MKKLVVTLGLLSGLVLSGAAQAASVTRVIHSGIDGWATPADGSTYTDFTREPIPAGFFCVSSAPFTGRIEYKGVPLATGEGKTLGNADTLVQRLDDAQFDKKGMATTRIQVRALQLVGTKPVKTSCGNFNAKMVLNGDQPTTKMTIVREKAEGGFYVANLAVNAKILFTPVGKPNAAPLVLRQEVRFNKNPRAPWSGTLPGLPEGVQPAAFVKVDTDGDGRVDSTLPGFSNFAAGSRGGQQRYGGCAYLDCHTYFDYTLGYDKQHCTCLCSGCAIP